jgi:hypothetical protein
MTLQCSAVQCSAESAQTAHTHLLIVEVVVCPGPLRAVGVTDERQEGEPLPALSGRQDGALVDELHCRPHRDGRERVEDLLHALVQLTNVLNLHPCVGDLEGAGQVVVAETLQRLVLEVELLEGKLESRQVGGLVAQRHRPEVFNPVLHKLLWRAPRPGGGLGGWRGADWLVLRLAV